MGAADRHLSEHDFGTRLATRKPFHLEATARVLQRRPSNLIDTWNRGQYRRLFATARGLVLVGVENAGTIDAPDPRFYVLNGNEPAAVEAWLRETLTRMLGLDIDPDPLQLLAQSAPSLRSTVVALRGMRPPRFANLFETFARVIPFQQLSIEAGTAIVARVVQRFGESIEQAGVRYFAFPTAETIAETSVDNLRACGLNLRKAKTLRYLAYLIAAGALREEEFEGARTTDALRLLMELPGIGAWSAALVLLRGFGRLDIFPPGDVGAARSLRELMQLDAGVAIENLAAHIGEQQRGFLYFCGLGGYLLKKGLIAPAPAKRQTFA